MKKLFAALLALMLLLTSTGMAEPVFTVWSALSEADTDALLSAYMEAADIDEIDLIVADQSVLLMMLKEEESPDVLLGVDQANCSELVECQPVRFAVTGSVLVVNTVLLDELGISVNGYTDLLVPELKGRIVMADPTENHIAFEHVANMLQTMGGIADAGWAHVSDFCNQLGGVMMPDMAAVYAAMISGEYAVALVNEGLAAELMVAEGVSLKMVYMQEGVILRDLCVVGMSDRAQALVDFCVSEKGQMLVNDMGMHAVSTAVASQLPENLVVFYDEAETVAANEADWAAQFMEIYERVQE